MEVTKKKEPEAQEQADKKPEIDSALLDELIKQYERPEQAAGPGGLLEQLTKRVYERILGAEMTHYLGYEKGKAPELEEGQRRENHRNGSSKKTLISEEGKFEIEVPRDRAGGFEPQFVAKGQKRFGGFEAQDHRDVRTRHECARDQALSGGAVQGRGFQRSDQHGHRLGHRRCARVAEPATGVDVPGDIFRCFAGQDSR